MSKNKKNILIILLFLAAITGIRFVWLYVLDTPNQPTVVRGQFDLREWDFENDGSLKLNGEWQWYPNVLLAQQSEHQVLEAKYINVPGNWSDAHSPPEGSPQGHGSYRLRILLDKDDEQIYGLHLPAISTSSEVYINGKLIEHAGKPAATAELYTPWAVPYIANFTAEEGIADIIIQVANYENAHQGGITQGITLGLTEPVHKKMWIALGTELTVFIIMLIHTIYVGLVYWIGIRVRGLIYFALLSLSTSIAILLDDHKLLLQFVNIDYWWSVKIQFISYMGAAISIMQMSKYLFTEFTRPGLIRWSTVLCLLVSAYILFAPAALITPIMPVYTIIMYTPYLIALWAVLKDVMSGKDDVIYLALGIVAIVVNLLWGIAKVAGHVDMHYYPVDIIISFLAFVGYWIKQYFSTSVQLQQTTEQLTKEHTLKDEFLANTSHELRNPLHSMINMAQDVLESDRKSLSADSMKNLDLVVTVGRRMSTMLTDLLDIARIRENRLQVNQSPLAIQNVASGVIDMLKYMTDNKPVLLMNEIPNSFPAVLADEGRLIQILFNLLHNAIKHTNEGYIAVRAEVLDGNAHIHIVDTGIGIAENMQQLLFLPYEQGAGSSSSGLGLGLHISKQLVELQGGTITVRSTLGEGSTFTFTLALASSTDALVDTFTDTLTAISRFDSNARSEQAHMKPDKVSDKVSVQLPDNATNVVMNEAAASSRKGQIDGITILAVDDDSVNLDILSRILRGEHYQVVTAASGKEALSILRSREIDLVISDVMMPQMSGYELTRLIREHYSISELPVLLLTARSSQVDIETGFLAGANDYVIKPMDAMEMRSRVRALTDFKHSVNERLKMEAAWLQAQIQPHFLFNTLNSIAALSDIDTERMHTLLEEFGHYLRASYDSRNSKQLVPLEHEISLVYSYLYIEKERFEHRLQVHWEIDDTVHIRIPPLSVQPLVENAVRHGIMKQFEGGSVTIRIQGYPDVVKISVIDNGVGIDEETVQRLLHPATSGRAGIGLFNTDRRLRRIYGSGLDIHSIPGKGTTVSFVVPLHSEMRIEAHEENDE